MCELPKPQPQVSEAALGAAEYITTQTTVIGIETNDKQYFVEIVPHDDLDTLAEMAELDQILFGEHKSLTRQELKNTQEHGELMAIRDEGGRMIAEAQVIIAATPDAEEPLVKVLPQKSSYLEGYAVTPEYRGTGTGIAILRAIESISREANKEDIWATVRVENAASIRNLTKEGYQIIGYAADYYGDEGLSGARLVMRKNLAEDENPLPLPTGYQEAHKIPVKVGDEPDLQAHKAILKSLNEGYIGTWIERDESSGQTYLLMQNSELIDTPASHAALISAQQLLRYHGITQTKLEI